MTHVTRTYVSCLLEQDIPLEAIIAELTLSGEGRARPSPGT